MALLSGVEVEAERLQESQPAAADMRPLLQPWLCCNQWVPPYAPHYSQPILHQCTPPCIPFNCLPCCPFCPGLACLPPCWLSCPALHWAWCLCYPVVCWLCWPASFASLLSSSHWPWPSCHPALEPSVFGPSPAIMYVMDPVAKEGLMNFTPMKGSASKYKWEKEELLVFDRW